MVGQVNGLSRIHLIFYFKNKQSNWFSSHSQPGLNDWISPSYNLPKWIIWIWIFKLPSGFFIAFACAPHVFLKVCCLQNINCRLTQQQCLSLSMIRHKIPIFEFFSFTFLSINQNAWEYESALEIISTTLISFLVY